MSTELIKTVLITGGGSGIGRELVKLFMQDNYKVIVFSLLQTELDDLEQALLSQYRKEQFTLLQADLSQAGAAQKIFTWCTENQQKIDVLVNNAGFAIAGEHVEQDIHAIHAMLTLNIIAVTELSLLFGHVMKAREHGQILNIGSTTGIAPVPLSGAYSASKAFINSFSVSLGIELAPYGVQVSCMEPYLTKTKFLSTCEQKSTQLNDRPADIKKQEETAHSVEAVAAYAYQGLTQGKAIILPGKLFKILAMLIRILPPKLVAKLFYKLTKSQA